MKSGRIWFWIHGRIDGPSGRPKGDVSYSQIADKMAYAATASVLALRRSLQSSSISVVQIR